MDKSLYFNGLTPAELERLAILSEELGEAQQKVGKILRHGYDNFNPNDRSSMSNRGDLQHELSDVIFAIRQLTAAGDLNGQMIEFHCRKKAAKIRPWLHHQDEEGNQ